jgi:hypothetical protein
VEWAVEEWAVAAVEEWAVAAVEEWAVEAVEEWAVSVVQEWAVAAEPVRAAVLVQKVFVYVPNVEAELFIRQVCRVSPPSVQNVENL